jgi:hypothetical protein
MAENYLPILTDESIVLANREILRSCGCSPAQVKEFSIREFQALPFWLRKKLKKIGQQDQEHKLKLQPKPDEYAFYKSPSLFPHQVKDGKLVMFTSKKKEKRDKIS